MFTLLGFGWIFLRFAMIFIYQQSPYTHLLKEHFPEGGVMALGVEIPVSRNVTLRFALRHPRCVGSITKNICVLHIQSNTTIFYLKMANI